MKRHNWWAWGQWLVIPLLVFGLVEAVVRGTLENVPGWYLAAEREAGQARVNVIFIGSSRVGAAVHVPSFEREVFSLTGHCPRALNLGRGYSTDAPAGSPPISRIALPTWTGGWNALNSPAPPA